MRVNAEKENIPKCGILETPQRRNLPGVGKVEAGKLPSQHSLNTTTLLYAHKSCSPFTALLKQTSIIIWSTGTHFSFLIASWLCLGKSPLLQCAEFSAM